MGGLFFLRELFYGGGQLPYFRDFHLYIYPNLVTWSEMVGAGHLPFWNPYLQGGVPFLADPAIGALYPFHFPFLLLSFPVAMPVFLVFHFAVALAGGYFWGRSQGLRWGAWATAIAIVGSGYLMGMVHNPIKLRGLVWTPWFWGCFRYGLGQGRKGYLVGAVVTWALIVLAGHFYGAYFAFLIALGESLVRQWESKEKVVLTALAVALLGGGLAAPQWLPTWNLRADSPRLQVASFESRAKWHLEWPRVVELAVAAPFGRDGPDAEYRPDSRRGGTWSSSIYLGGLTLLLAGIALVRETNRCHLYWAGIGLAGLVLATGPPLLYDLFIYLPGGSGFRYPEKLIWWTTLAAALLAGRGFDILFRADEIRGKSVFLTAIFAGAAFFLVPPLPVVTVEAHPFAVQGKSLFRGALVLLVAAFLIWRRRQLPMAGAFLLLWMAVDLGRAHQGLPLVESDFYRKKPAHLDDVPGPQWHHHRLARYPVEGLLSSDRPLSAREFIQRERDTLAGNIPSVYGYPRVHGLSLVRSERYLDFWKVWRGRPLVGYQLAGGRYLLSEREKKIGWRDLAVLPRAKFYSQIHPVSSPSAATEKLGKIRPLQEVVVEGTVSSEKRKKSPFPATTKLVSYDWNRIVVQVHCATPGVVVLFDSFHRGWQAQVNGEPRSVLPAQLLFRGVALEPGHRQVEFTYTPPGWIVGLILAGISLVLLAMGTTWIVVGKVRST